MRKPKSLKKPTQRKERHKYKSAKGRAFPRKKIKRFPGLREMYKDLKRLEGKGEYSNQKATADYVTTRLFSPKMKGLLAALEYRVPPDIELANKPEGKAYIASLRATFNNVRACGKQELQKIEKALKAAKKELGIANEYIQKECYSAKALSETPKEAAYIRHEFKNKSYGMKKHLDRIEEIIKKRKGLKKSI